MQITGTRGAPGAGNALSSGRRCSASTAFKPSLSMRPDAHPHDGAMIDVDDYGRHEAMHTASVFALMVDNHLRGHPQVQNNAQWQAHAQRAVDALWDLYRGIAEVHIRDR